MLHRRRLLSAAAAAAVLGAGGRGAASPPAPRVGQPGKDVLWAPSSDAIVARMLALAEVTAADVVLDLGSGDGKIPIAAAKTYGARGVGVEFDAALVALSRQRAQMAGVTQRVRFEQGDLFAADLSAATVITLYLLPTINLRLRPKLLELRPGVRIVSHAFDMAEWRADALASDGLERAFLWRVPARVAGRWRAQSASLGVGELELSQRFQEVEGRALFGGFGALIRGARLAGADLAFRLRGRGGRFWRIEGRFGEQDFAGTAASEGLIEPFAMRR